MTNRQQSGSGPGQFEDQDPCLSVTTEADRLESDSHGTDSLAPQRAFRLTGLLNWFPLSFEAIQEIFSAQRVERLTLADVALHLWGLNTPPEPPIAQMSEAEFRKYLAGLGMLPGWFRRPSFLHHSSLVAWAKSRADMFRTYDLAEYDEAAMIARLRHVGWTERMVGQEIPFEELRRPAFPIRVARSESDAHQQGDFDYLRDALAATDKLISLADLEQLLLDRKRSEYGWFREYIT